MSAIRRRKPRKSPSEKALIEAQKKDAQALAELIYDSFTEYKVKIEAATSLRTL